MKQQLEHIDFFALSAARSFYSTLFSKIEKIMSTVIFSQTKMIIQDIILQMHFVF